MLAKQLKKLRDNRKITQKNLAEMLGISASTIAGWETGDRHPDHLMLIKIADTFGVSVDSLLGRSNLDVKVDFNSDRIKYKSEVEKLEDEVIHSINQALIDGILTEEQAKISLQACQNIMELLAKSNQKK